MARAALSARIETWPIEGTFAISRGAKREAVVVVAEVSDGDIVGRGECVPYPRYGQTAEGTLAEIEVLASSFVPDRNALLRTLPASATRNAIDCALWDFEAKQAGRRVFELAGIAAPGAVMTCYTLSLDGPDAMAAKASARGDLPLLKLKLGETGAPARDIERMRQVRRARPDARLVVDANEGWRPDDLGALLDVAAETGVELVEQPLPEGVDAALAAFPHPVPVCADESAHATQGLAGLTDRYDAVNIKLDKSGGLTEALAMAREARRLGLRIMVGSMVATSLSMAPALLLAGEADWADLDSPLLLSRDRVPGLRIENGIIQPPRPDLWG
ncbi:MAG: N-acetyl-D-Glu racemase DgcA [Hyphomicrobiaceae bacterium]